MDILNFLYDKIDYSKENIQTYIAKDKSKVLICMPSADKYISKEKIEKMLLLKNIKRGFTGITYPSLEIPYKQQEGLLYWFGIDIDSKDVGISNSFVPKIIKAMGDYATIRTSTGGKGLHLLFRLKTPLKYKCDMQYYIKQLAEPYIKKLDKIGISSDKTDNIHICKVGGNFYLTGGLQTTLSLANLKINTDRIDLNEYYSNMRGTNKSISRNDFFGASNKRIKSFIEDLEKEGCVDTTYLSNTFPVNTGTVFDIICNHKLDGMLIIENIESDMLNADINGYINIFYDELTVFEFNSNKIIFKIQFFKIYTI